MCSANMQQIYRKTPMQKCDFSNVANQFYWNHTVAWVFSCKFAGYLQKSCSDEHLWGTTSADFHSTCLPYFSLQIGVKFGLFSNTFLFRLAPCERHFLQRFVGFSFCKVVPENCKLLRSFFFRKKFLQQKLVLLLIFDAS